MIFFVHIGKTGGTALKRQIRAHHGVGRKKEPQIVGEKFVLLNHMSLSDAVERFGEPSGIAFAFRDPTARFVSGFYCRQRMGWPEHRALWDPREAAAFAHFDDANTLAEALDSDAPKDRAAAQYAMQAIRHLRRGYRYHFGDMANFLLDYGDRITACIDTSDISGKGGDFMAALGLTATDAEQPDRPGTPPYPKDLSERARKNLRDIWGPEYAYYDAFKALQPTLF